MWPRQLVEAPMPEEPLAMLLSVLAEGQALVGVDHLVEQCVHQVTLLPPLEQGCAEQDGAAPAAKCLEVALPDTLRHVWAPVHLHGT